MDIASLVRAVVTAFDDASKLVLRIRDHRKSSDRALPEQATRDLLDSLALAPVIVRGHFDHDFKRFGEPYACGDIQARESMKDVLINLQMTLIIALKSSGMDDVDLDFDALQTSSDDCRVNAGVCLGQLSQRLSDVAKAQAMYPPNAMGYSNGLDMAPPTAPSLAYSSSRSTLSSKYAPRTPSDGLAERFATMSVSTARPFTSRRTATGSIGSSAQSPPHIDRTVTSRAAPADNFGRLPVQGGQVDQDAADALSTRRPSSHTLALEDDNLLAADDSPPKNPPRSPPVQDPSRGSYMSSKAHSQNGCESEPSRLANVQQNASSRDRYGPENYIPVGENRPFSHPTSNDMYRAQSSENEPPPTSFSTRAHEANHSTLEHIRYLQRNTRPPRHGSNHFPPPSASGPPLDHSLPQPPSFQTRRDSLNTPPSRQAPVPDTLSLFPQPKATLPPQQTIKVPLSRLNTRPSNSGPIPVQMPQSPPRQLPPPLPRVPTNTSNAAFSPFPHVPTALSPIGSHPLSHPPSVHSNDNDGPASTPQSAAPPSTTSLTQQTSLPARPETAMSVLPTNVPLTLPTDKNPLGFCRCAARLFLSPDSDPKQSKSFTVANRPIGINSLISYWACQKCNFEGPLCTTINVTDGGGKKKKKGKEEKMFDPKVRVSNGGGVRYRWTFLAKSHLHLKSHVDHLGGGRPAREGEVGAFGCLFCCAEGVARGWTPSQLHNSTPSVRSGSTGSSGLGDGKGTPTFGTVNGFMEHLEMHRREEGWPGAEMLGRMKCVVGRVAGGDEEWEINFTPLM